MPVWNKFASCSLPEEYIFPRSFYAFLAIFTSGKIDSDVVCLQFALIMARFGNVNADEITYIFFLLYPEWDVKHSIAFSLGNSLPIVLFGEV